MVETIRGYNKKEEIVFERPARDYEKELSKMVLGLSIGDLIKIGTIVVACTVFYIKNENFKETQSNFNSQMIESTHKNTAAINAIHETLGNLDTYLSSTAGRQFKDGRPISLSQIADERT